MEFLLYPLSLIYKLVIFIRNKFYDWGIFKSMVPDVPTICIGNLTTGGTGKTPHTEYLIRLLKKKYKVATLSRGYKRMSKGFVLADGKSGFEDLGDEPLQFHLKFPDITVAVDEDRVDGICKLLEGDGKPDVILLDDAFQHRAVKAHVSILLCNYFDIIKKNSFLLPAGNYREPLSSKKRADYVIITNSEPVISPILEREIADILKLSPNQKLLFSNVEYIGLKPINAAAKNFDSEINSILLFTGIADSYQLEIYLKGLCYNLDVLRFQDHHKFTENDLKKIASDFTDIPSKRKIIVITEKDYMRLHGNRLLSVLDDCPLFYIPIKIKINRIENPDKLFDKQIIGIIERLLGR